MPAQSQTRAACADDRAALRAARQDGVGLCTIVGIEGSFSRRLGAQLAVHPDGAITGSLADGCLEQQLASEIRDTSGKPAVTVEIMQMGWMKDMVSFDTFIRSIRDEAPAMPAEQSPSLPQQTSTGNVVAEQAEKVPSASISVGHGAAVFTGDLLACQSACCGFAALLRRVVGFPDLGLLRGLRPISGSSVDDGPARRRPGGAAGRAIPRWFPRSPCTG